ncbi:unnamed protein product, partial [Medioppia subpectinata]
MFDKSFESYTNWLITIAIGLITVYLVKFYAKVYSLPRGPFPFPVLGNILLFRNTKVNQFETITELHKTYGPVYTLWLGSQPLVSISDYNLVKTGFNSKNNELMGRNRIGFAKILLQGGCDVVFTDHGPVWASLRRVAHSAVRKLAISERLSDLVDDVVDETVQTMKKTHPIGTPFNPKSFIYANVVNIIASSTFGKRYQFEDEELKFIENSFECFRANTTDLVLVDQMPVLRLVPKYAKTAAKTIQTLEAMTTRVKQQYLSRLTTHSSGVVNDFCDALIEAKEEAIQEAKESAAALTDHNLSLVIM